MGRSVLLAIHTMAELNLLPTSLLRARNARKVATLGAGLIVGIALVLGVLYWMIGSATDAARSEMQAPKIAAANKVTTSPASVGTTPAEDADTTMRITALNVLGTTELNWPVALQLPGSLLTSSVRLSTYSYAVTPASITLQMSGQAASTVSFASFIQGLQSNASIKTISVSSYTYQPATASVGFGVSLILDPKSVQYAALSTPKPVK